MVPEPVRVISKNIGSKFVESSDGLVVKCGWRVQKAEFLAMKLVVEHTSVPIPAPISWESRGPDHGEITMTLVPGVCLRDVWDDLNRGEKKSICTQVWGLSEKWKSIPKPQHLRHLYQWKVDGTVGDSVFISKHELDLQEQKSDICSDEELRWKICHNYYKEYGRVHTKQELFNLLPRSDTSVFVHGELLPKKIMVSGSQVTAIIDWETAGWYPEYWEHICLVRLPSDWKAVMTACAPKTWDLTGFKEASRVLM